MKFDKDATMKDRISEHKNAIRKYYGSSNTVLSYMNILQQTNPLGIGWGISSASEIKSLLWKGQTTYQITDESGVCNFQNRRYIIDSNNATIDKYIDGTQSEGLLYIQVKHDLIGGRTNPSDVASVPLEGEGYFGFLISDQPSTSSNINAANITIESVFDSLPGTNKIAHWIEKNAGNLTRIVKSYGGFGFGSDAANIGGAISGNSVFFGFHFDINSNIILSFLENSNGVSVSAHASPYNTTPKYVTFVTYINNIGNQQLHFPMLKIPDTQGSYQEFESPTNCNYNIKFSLGICKN